MHKYAVLFAFAMAMAAAIAIEYDGEDITAYHFHTYIFVGNERAEKEATDFRKALRSKMNDGHLSACSMNAIRVGKLGPHPFSQWEMCCNMTSFPQATAFHMKNHGNLSVLIHPLTRQDREDHMGRATWIGHSIPLDAESGLFDELPSPRICPVYPDTADEIPRSGNVFYEPIPGTEDFAYLYAKYN